MKIAFLFNTGRSARLPEVRLRESPSDFFYGALEMEDRGHFVQHFEFIANIPVRFPYALVNVLLNFGYSPAYMDGGLLKQIKDIAHELNKFDCIVATTTGISFCLALLKKVDYVKRPIVAIQCGLFNSRYNMVRSFFTSSLLKELDNIFFGDGEISEVHSLLSSCRKNINVCQFGIDVKFWNKANIQKKNFVLCVGNDGRRDFDCLLKAAQAIPTEIKLLTKRIISSLLPSNVSLIRNCSGEKYITDIELRLLYQESKCVIIPLIEALQPSGQSVALQAMACGTPVVITSTNGFWDSSVFENGKNLLFAKCGDPVDLSNKVNHILDSDELANNISMNAYKCVEEFYSIDNFSKCIEHHCVDATIEFPRL